MAHPWNIQGQVGQGSEQPDPAEDVPAHCRGGLNGAKWPLEALTNPNYFMSL